MDRNRGASQFVGIALVAVVIAGHEGLAFAQAPPGTSYPSQKIAFNDPASGKPVVRITLDGQKGCRNRLTATEMSSQASIFSPDSLTITYAKVCDSAIKPD